MKCINIYIFLVIFIISQKGFIFSYDMSDDVKEINRNIPKIIKRGNFKFKKIEEQNYFEGKMVFYIFKNVEIDEEGIISLENKTIELIEMNEIIPGKSTVKKLERLLGQPSEIIITKASNKEYLSYNYGNIQFFFGIEGTNIIEIRVGKNTREIPLLYMKKIGLKSTVNEVIAILGKPEKTILNEKIIFNNYNTLFMDIDGIKGFGYIDYHEKGVRFFFSDNKVTAMYFYEK